MKRFSIVHILSFLLVSLLISGVSCKHKSPVSIQPPETKKLETQTVSQWNGQYIVGTVKNMGDDKISYVSVEFYLTDVHMMPIRSVGASSDQGIEPRGEWEFRILAADARARGTRLNSTVVR